MFFDYKCGYCGKEETRSVLIKDMDDQYCECWIGYACVHKDAKGRDKDIIELTPENAQHPKMRRLPAWKDINIRPGESKAKALELLKEQGKKEGWVSEVG